MVLGLRLDRCLLLNDLHPGRKRMGHNTSFKKLKDWALSHKQKTLKIMCTVFKIPVITRSHVQIALFQTPMVVLKHEICLRESTY